MGCQIAVVKLCLLFQMTRTLGALLGDNCTRLTLRSKGRGWLLTVSIRDGEEVMAWDPIIDAFDQKRLRTEYVQNTTEGCKVQICHDLGKTYEPQYNFACSGLTSEYVEYMSKNKYPLVGARCSCQKNSSVECWRQTDACPVKEEEVKVTGCHLFGGYACDTCHHGFIRLQNGSNFTPTLQMRSLLLGPACFLTYKWNGNNSQTYQQKYLESTNFLQENWNLNGGAIVTCNCTVPQKVTSTTPRTTTPEPPSAYSETRKYLLRLLAICFGALGLALLILSIILLVARLRSKGKIVGNGEYDLKELNSRTGAEVTRGVDGSSEPMKSVNLKSLNQNGACSSGGVLSAAGAEMAQKLQNSAQNKIWGKVVEDLKNYEPVPVIAEEELEIYDETVNENVLGRGEYGFVLRGKLRQHGIPSSTHPPCASMGLAVAIKKVNPDQPSYFGALTDELKILAYIGKHPNIINLMGYFKGNLELCQLYLIFELTEHESLRNYIELKVNPKLTTENSEIKALHTTYCVIKTIKPKESSIPVSQLVLWGRQIATGLEFLHSKNVIHRDLAARNILLPHDLVAKIGDFGLARHLTRLSPVYTQQSVNPIAWKWIAIESLSSNIFTYASDLWSLGMTLWEIFDLAGFREPYDGIAVNEQQLSEQLGANFRLEIPLYATQEIYTKICECWNANPCQRPSATDLKDFFSNLEQQNMYK